MWVYCWFAICVFYSLHQVFKGLQATTQSHLQYPVLPSPKRSAWPSPGRMAPRDRLPHRCHRWLLPHTIQCPGAGLTARVADQQDTATRGPQVARVLVEDRTREQERRKNGFLHFQALRLSYSQARGALVPGEEHVLYDFVRRRESTEPI